mmetsp:Transcript_83458/g.241518  ORF Transcript_83458/g.241518 Transcript_83458/m.241518 type:complete len:104 (-) Transcript_83458:359-670(-)
MLAVTCIDALVAQSSDCLVMRGGDTAGEGVVKDRSIGGAVGTETAPPRTSATEARGGLQGASRMLQPPEQGKALGDPGATASGPTCASADVDPTDVICGEQAR